MMHLAVRTGRDPFGRHAGSGLHGRDADLAQAPRAIANAALLTVVDQLEQGIVVADEGAGVHFLNRAARDLVARGAVRIQGGCLRASEPRDTATLHQAIGASAAGGARASVARLIGRQAQRLLMIAAPMPLDALDARQRLVVVLLIDPVDARLPDPALLRRQFDLTPAEAALAGEILRGDGLSACAARLGIKPSTARTHLRRVFEKTGTHRQAELVRLLVLCRPILADGGVRCELRQAGVG